MKRLNVKFSEELRAAIREEATQRGMTMNQLVIEALRWYLEDSPPIAEEAHPDTQGAPRPSAHRED